VKQGWPPPSVTARVEKWFDRNTADWPRVRKKGSVRLTVHSVPWQPSEYGPPLKLLALSSGALWNNGKPACRAPPSAGAPASVLKSVLLPSS
jgi:hypothetical protein